MQKFLGLVAVIVLLFPQNCFAEIKKTNHHLVFDSAPLNLEEIIKVSDRIFAGTCKDIEEVKKDQQSNLQVIKYTFKITEGLKGTDNNSEIIFKQWAPVSKQINYRKGKKYIVFLYPNSRLGLTSTAGVLQGQFLVEQGPDRAEFIRNSLNNEGLAVNPKTKKAIVIRKNRALNNYIYKTSEKGKSIRYKEFTDAVRLLLEQ